jgi:hypothetical protein
MGSAVVRSGWMVRSGEDFLDVVALTEDLPERGLQRGQVGTVVEVLEPGVLEVEFSDDEGRAYASVALKADQVLMLHYEPVLGKGWVEPSTFCQAFEICVE